MIDDNNRWEDIGSDGCYDRFDSPALCVADNTQLPWQNCLYPHKNSDKGDVNGLYVSPDQIYTDLSKLMFENMWNGA